MMKKSFMKDKRFVTCVKEEFCTDENEKNKVRDHCHYTGKFRGAAHSICNLR